MLKIIKFYTVLCHKLIKYFFITHLNLLSFVVGMISVCHIIPVFITCEKAELFFGYNIIHFYIL